MARVRLRPDSDPKYLTANIHASNHAHIPLLPHLHPFINHADLSHGNGNNIRRQSCHEDLAGITHRYLNQKWR